MERIVLRARQGYVFTNGKDYGSIIYPANGVSTNDYYEITEEEYKKIVEKQNEELGEF